MKSLKIAAAVGLMVAGVGVSTSADAQRYDHGDRRDWRGGHHDGRDWRDGRRGYYGHDRGYGYGRSGYGYNRGWHGRRDCRTTYRYHRPVTVCYR